MKEISEVEKRMNLAPFYSWENGQNFSMKIGGTMYKVNTFWNSEGTQTVLQQFMDMLQDKF